MVAEKLDPSDHPTQTKRQVQLTFSETCRQTTVTLPERGVQTETIELDPGEAARDLGAPVVPLPAQVGAGVRLAALRAHRAFQTETIELDPGEATRDLGAPAMPLSARVEVGMSLAALRAHRAFKTPNRRRVVVSMRSTTPLGTASAVPQTSLGPSLAPESPACLEEGRELGHARGPPTGCPMSPREGGPEGRKRRRRGTRGKGRACRTPRPVSMTHGAEDLMPGPRGGMLTPKPGH